jgi:hypothetical protein
VGSRSTTSQDRWVASQVRIARLRWAGSPSHNKVAFSPPRKAAQLAEHLDEGVGVVVARLDVEGELGATAADAVAERGAMEAFFQLNGWVNVGGWPLGAQLRRTFGVRLSALSSKKTRQTSHVVWLSSHSCFCLCVLRPSGRLVVAGVGPQAAVEDADQAVGELAQRRVMADTAGA